MADDVRRWSVTYTKHIHQKRKVYLDGFLELQSSSHKVKLYDDCDKLLDSRIVKLNDAVRSGETLTCGAFLVDIGDPHGESKPIPNLILQRDKTMADRDGNPNSRTSKGSLHVGKRSSINLSPSHKIIREFKRREVNKYSSSPNVQDTVKADSTEWEVLYTAQLTQKAKKFHDGILKVANSGLTGRQAFLYDGTRKLLECRFLRNEEKIKVGESLRFDGHIMDILEPKDNKTQKGTNVDRSNCDMQSTVQSKIHDEHLADFKKREANKSSISASCPYTTKTNITEWDVMYTTQVTQKAKKFHDGVLKLASSGSQGRQEATLLAEDGTVLSHRYLKLSEDINGGSSFNMTNYLVEVGEPRKHSEGECPRNACTGENETPDVRSFNVDSIKLCKKIPATRPLSDEKPPKRASTLQDIASKAKKSVADKVIPTTISKNKPLCDEWDVMYTTQITQKAKKYHDGVLKISSCGSLGRQEATLLADDGMILSQRYLKLSEEISCGSSFNMPNYLLEVGEPRKCYEEGCPKKTSTSESETPETTTFDVDDIKLCKRMPTTKLLSDGNVITRSPPLQDTDSKVTNSIADKVTAATISKNKPLRDAHSILSFLKKPSAQDAVMEKVNGKEIQPSQDLAFVQSGIQYQVEGHSDSCSKISEEAVCNEETRAANVGGHPEAMSSEATSTSSFNELAKKTKDQINTEISGDSRIIDFSVHDVSIDTKKGFKELSSRNDEFPSFDLGID